MRFWGLVLSLFLLTNFAFASEKDGKLYCDICGTQIGLGKLYQPKVEMRFNTDTYESTTDYKNGVAGSIPQHYESITIILGEKCGKKLEALIKDPPYGYERNSVVKTLLGAYMDDRIPTPSLKKIVY